MRQEMRGVRVGRISIGGGDVAIELVVGLRDGGVVVVVVLLVVVMLRAILVVIEYDDFINAEDRKGPCNDARKECLLFDRLGAVAMSRECLLGGILSQGDQLGPYLATMLPGIATLRVWERPPVGSKTAEGFSVKTSSCACPPCPGGFCSWKVLRF